MKGKSMYYLSLHLAFSLSLPRTKSPTHYCFLIKIPLTSTMLVGIKVLTWVDIMRADEVQRGFQQVSWEKEIMKSSRCEISVEHNCGVNMWHCFYCTYYEVSTVWTTVLSHEPEDMFSSHSDRVSLGVGGSDRGNNATWKVLCAACVCVLSQGGMASDGRKGNRMYSYPL